MAFLTFSADPLVVDSRYTLALYKSFSYLLMLWCAVFTLICDRKTRTLRYWRQRADKACNVPLRSPGACELGVSKSMECDTFFLQCSDTVGGATEGQPAYKKSWVLVRWWWQFGWSFARLTTNSTIFCCNKIQNWEILVYRAWLHTTNCVCCLQSWRTERTGERDAGGAPRTTNTDGVGFETWPGSERGMGCHRTWLVHFTVSSRVSTSGKGHALCHEGPDCRSRWTLLHRSSQRTHLTVHVYSCKCAQLNFFWAKLVLLPLHLFIPTPMLVAMTW